MDRKVKSFRLRVDLLDWVKAYAGTRGSTEVAVLEEALASLKRDAEGGVPDLPAAETSKPEYEAGSHGPAARRVARVETQHDWAMARQAKLNAGKYR